ncbi:MAG: hypothetical protein ACKO8W_02955 [Dolichospermum sp.]
MLVVSCWLSVVSGQLSVVSCQWSVVSCQWSVVKKFINLDINYELWTRD